MRLVRGSILSSKPCSASQAARILRRFLSSDEGTDIYVTSFLNRAARSLESMSEGGHSTEKKKRGLDPQTSQMFENPKNPNEGISGLGYRDESSGGKHMRKREIGNAEESTKLAKKLRAKHVVEGGESEVDSGLFTTPLVEKSENREGTMGVRRLP